MKANTPRFWDHESNKMFVPGKDYFALNLFYEGSYQLLDKQSSILTHDLDSIILNPINKTDMDGNVLYAGDILEVYPVDKDNFGEKAVFYISEGVNMWGPETDWEHVSGYNCPTHIVEENDEEDGYTNVRRIGNIYENPERANLEPYVHEAEPATPDSVRVMVECEKQG